MLIIYFIDFLLLSLFLFLIVCLKFNVYCVSYM